MLRRGEAGLHGHNSHFWHIVQPCSCSIFTTIQQPTTLEHADYVHCVCKLSYLENELCETVIRGCSIF